MGPKGPAGIKGEPGAKGEPSTQVSDQKKLETMRMENINDERDYGLIKTEKTNFMLVILSAAKQLQKQVRPQRLYYFVESEMKSSFDRSFF